ncbi:MAG: shikimate dehydrogenase [Desulfurispora sp.]|uniref:shikimate dehydrogenase n=1 Tax=Desulfurispora sp. TaxID=3014275 RepID=UPI0040497DCD
MPGTIDGQTRVTGLFGYPVKHTLSPAMHNAAFDQAGLNWVYVAWPVKPEALAGALSAVRALDMPGVNLTIPHKEAAAAYLDELDGLARLTGAVNTVVNREGRLVGYNTDAPGFTLFLQRDLNFPPAGRRAILLGTGGAARAVAAGLLQEGLDFLWLSGRSREKSHQLENELAYHFPGRTATLPWYDAGDRAAGAAWATALRSAGLVVQTTPLGMSPCIDALPPFPFELLTPGHLVVDIVYNPPRTLFLQKAAARGARVENGLGMLLYQGALAWELWTGRTAPVPAMRRALQSSHQSSDFGLQK